jgi:hypothetical protein
VVRNVLVAATILVLTGLSMHWPGWGYLEDDTQIYDAILQHQRDPAVLRNDIVAARSHLSFTIFDEATNILRTGNGLSVRGAALLQMFVFRGLGALGVYLIVLSLGLSFPAALLGAGIFSLGIDMAGFVTVEWEPVPRGFSIGLQFLAIGLAAHRKHILAGFAVAVALLYHPVQTAPCLAVLVLLAVWPASRETRISRLWGLTPVAAAVVMLLILARLQTGVAEPQSLFGKIGPELESLLRMREQPVWVSMWFRNWVLSSFVLLTVSLIGWIRLKNVMRFDLAVFILALPAVSILMAPASYLMLEHWKLWIVPQMQPLRFLFWLPAMAMITACGAGFLALREKRITESAIWLTIVAALPVNPRLLDFPRAFVLDSMQYKLAVTIFIAALLLTAAWTESRWHRRALPVWAAALACPFYLLPTVDHVWPPSSSQSPEVAMLSGWARADTAPDAVFAFPDAGRALYPGVFRARSSRAVYVDWKGGGQINYFRGFAEEWGKRWKQTMQEPFQAEKCEGLAQLGIDYVVLDVRHRLTSRAPRFENASFLVYRVR